MKDKCCIIAT